MTNVFKTMRRISKIGSWAFVGAILGGCVASLANFGLNFTFGKMTQISIEQATAGTFDLQILLTITGLFLLMFPLLVMGQTGNLMGGLNAEKRLKEHMIHHILRQKEATIRASHTGDMMTLLTSDADVINNYYFQGFNYMFIHPTVGGLAALITTFFVDVRFGVIAVVLGIVSVWVATRYADAIQTDYVSARNFQNKATNHVSDIIANETMVRLYNAQNTVVDDYRELNQAHAKALINAEVKKHRVTMWNDGFGALGKILFVGIGFYLALTTDFEFAKVMLLLPLQASIGYMFGNFGVAWNYILEVQTSADRILTMLDMECEEGRIDRQDLSLGKGHDLITFDQVQFGYQPDHTILKSVDFTISPQSKVAFVGESGSGKSTIFQLLLGFYKPDQGRILLDGKDVQDYSLQSVRNQICYVQQESPLFNTTIRENIRLGSKGIVTDAMIEAAARKAAIHDFIVSLPQGYDTHVGEQGGMLSGGQRQRIAIARALISEAPILIMDEPTSALGSESEQLIQKAIANIQKEKTILIAAHRLSTIRDADKIIVLNHGVIVEMGTHDSLLTEHGVYERFVQSQHI